MRSSGAACTGGSVLGCSGGVAQNVDAAGLPGRRSPRLEARISLLGGVWDSGPPTYFHRVSPVRRVRWSCLQLRVAPSDLRCPLDGCPRYGGATRGVSAKRQGWSRGLGASWGGGCGLRAVGVGSCLRAGAEFREGGSAHAPVSGASAAPSFFAGFTAWLPSSLNPIPRLWAPGPMQRQLGIRGAGPTLGSLGG